MEEVADLVEARDRDLQAVVLVEVIRREDAGPDDRSGHRDEREEPGRRRHGRQRRDVRRDDVGRRVRDRRARRVPDREHPGAPAAQPCRRDERRRPQLRRRRQRRFPSSVPLSTSLARTRGSTGLTLGVDRWASVGQNRKTNRSKRRLAIVLTEGLGPCPTTGFRVPPTTAGGSAHRVCTCPDAEVEATRDFVATSSMEARTRSVPRAITEIHNDGAPVAGV